MKQSQIIPLFASFCLLSCSSTQSVVNRARGGPIEKHGVAGTVPCDPSPWHYGLVPFAAVLDLLTTPFRIAEWVNEDD